MPQVSHSDIDWSNLENFIVYDKELMEECSYIEDSIYCLEEAKFYTPKIKFLREEPGSNSVTLSLFIPEVQHSTSLRSTSLFMNFSEMRTEVGVSIEKDYFQELLLKCSKQKKLIWKDSSFSDILKDCIIKLADTLVKDTEKTYIVKGRTYTLSNSIGNIYGPNGQKAGIFSGLILKVTGEKKFKPSNHPFTMQIPKMIFNYEQFNLPDCTAEYIDLASNMEISFSCNGLKRKDVESYQMIDSKSIVISAIPNEERKWYEGDYLHLINKELFLAKKRLDYRLYVLQEPLTKKIVENEATKLSFKLKNRFTSLLDKEV